MATINIFKHEPDVESFAAGETIFAQGELGSLMYVVQSGAVEIIVGDNVVESVGPGGVLGEMALVDNSPRSATAVACTNVKLVALDEAKFMSHVNLTPFFSLQVMRVMADRLRAMNAHVAGV